MKIKNEIKYIWNAFMTYASFLGSPFFSFFAILLFISLNQFAFASKLTIAVLIWLAVEHGIKLLYKEKRPDFKQIKPYSLYQTFQEKTSFPSGHAGAIALFTVLIAKYYANIYLTGLFVLFSVFVGLSRIQMCRHYFKDVLAGYLLGILIASIV